MIGGRTFRFCGAGLIDNKHLCLASGIVAASQQTILKQVTYSPGYRREEQMALKTGDTVWHPGCNNSKYWATNVYGRICYSK